MRLKNAIHASMYIRGYPMLTLYIAGAERDVGMKNLSRKEALKILDGMKVKIKIPKAAVTQWERNTALDMAIEALKCSGVPNSSDCISRQAAIDAIWDGTNYDIYTREVKEILEELPSAQPKKCSEVLQDMMDNDYDLYCHMGISRFDDRTWDWLIEQAKEIEQNG